jgi:Domain of unknown function (DUF6980)
MLCQEFQTCFHARISKKAGKMSIPPAEQVAYFAWCDHMHGCASCSKWYMAQQAIEAGQDVKAFPCVHLAYYSRLDCEQHDDPQECPDVLIVKTQDGFGIPVRDGGHSLVAIKFCPWCGTAIPGAASI